MTEKLFGRILFTLLKFSSSLFKDYFQFSVTGILCKSFNQRLRIRRKISIAYKITLQRRWQ